MPYSARSLGAGACALICSLWQPAALAAAPADDELGEVLVLGQLEAALPQQLARLGSRVETIESDQLQKGGFQDVAQALQALAPGMYISPLSGAFDYVEVSLQGSRSSEVLWLVDGIRINNRLYSTTTPLDTIPAHQVDRVEIIEGGQGLFYGTQSVAGTVNIVTREFADAPEGRVELGLDTNDGQHLSASWRTAIGAHRLVAFASRDKADGFQPFSDADFQPSGTDRERGYDVANYGLKYAYDFGDRVRTSFGFQHTDADLDYVRPFNIASASNDRNEDLLTAKVDIAATDSLDLYVKGYYHDWDTLYNEIDNDGVGGTEVISENEFWGFEDYGVNLLAKYSPGGVFEYLAGWDYQHYSGEDEVFLIAPLAETVHAPFAQIRTSAAWRNDLRLSLGARYNNPDYGQSATVWTATGHWDINDGLFTRASFGTAFRLPDAYELFVVDPCCEQGNPDLKPERSQYLNFSVGGRAAAGDTQLGWELVGFFRDIKDLIDIVDAPGGGETLDNIAGTTQVRGGELILSGRHAAGLSANLSFTLTDANPAGSSQQQQEIPTSLAKLAVGYAPEGGRFFAGGSLSHTGNVYRNAGGARRNYGDHAVVELNGGVRFGADGHHQVSARLENAFDEDYAARIRSGSTDGGDPYAYSFRGTPRTLHVNYALQF